MLFRKMTVIETLGRKHSIPILIALYKSNAFQKGVMYQLLLKEKLGHKSESIKNRLNELRHEKLLDFKVEIKFQAREDIWLTSKGKQVAEKLVEIEKIIEKLKL